MKILITFVRKGESLPEATARIGALANQLNFNGYAIHCELCGRRIDKHDFDRRFENCPDEQNLALLMLDNKGMVVL